MYMALSTGIQSPMTDQQRAFLDMIAESEIGHRMLLLSRNGYNVCVGSTPEKMILFSDYSKHPRIRCERLNSDAAGRYQFMGRYWEFYRKQLSLPDFGPGSQDKWALQLIRECGALVDIEAGRIETAIHKCRSRWASFPAAGYAQTERPLGFLLAAFETAGGVTA
jgi:muramidase (phage lysozyme)